MGLCQEFCAPCSLADGTVYLFSGNCGRIGKAFRIGDSTFCKYVGRARGIGYPVGFNLYVQELLCWSSNGYRCGFDEPVGAFCGVSTGVYFYVSDDYIHRLCSKAGALISLWLVVRCS